MKSAAAAFICVTILTLAGQGSARSPKEIGGFTLGAKVEQYRDVLDVNSAFPLSEMRYLSEIGTGGVKGFKKATIVFGNCSNPGRIVRIKLKYTDSTMQFYDQLLEAFKKNFGPPDEWRGDAFHRFVAWKWSFETAAGQSVSMILQHAQPDDLDHPSGNVIKLTNWTWIDQERRCYNEKLPQPNVAATPTQKSEEAPLDFGHFIPK